jgi:hypothetical protein
MGSKQQRRPVSPSGPSGGASEKIILRDSRKTEFLHLGHERATRRLVGAVASSSTAPRTVAHAPDAQRSLRAVGLRDVTPFGRACSVAAFVNPLVQVCQLRFEVFSVGLPRHAIDPRRSITLERMVALLQEVGGDVMQQYGKPHISTLSRRPEA